MWSSQRERVCLEERLHPVLLAPSFVRALGLAGLGALLSQLGWFLAPIGAVLVGVGAFVAVVAVWRWERTRLVVTTDKIYVVHGTFRRRAAGVRLGRAGAIEVEQTLLGRLLGYGTLIAANLEIDFVADPQEVWNLVGGTRLEDIDLHERELDGDGEHDAEPARRPLRVAPHARRRTA
jgi:Bacterial PH domain